MKKQASDYGPATSAIEIVFQFKYVDRTYRVLYDQETKNVIVQMASGEQWQHLDAPAPATWEYALVMFFRSFLMQPAIKGAMQRMTMQQKVKAKKRGK